jgi:Predicted nucleotide-binding protein containing TIR-like domain
VAFVISDEYGKAPTRPVDVAAAMELAPAAGHFKTLTGSTVAYGFTEGASQADLISLTPLGLRVVAPQEEGDDLLAKREALLHPRLPREFLERYDGSKLPSETIGRNVLEGLGCPTEACERTLKLIVDSADALGLLREIKGAKYVNLKPAGTQTAIDGQQSGVDAADVETGPDEGEADSTETISGEPTQTAKAAEAPANRKVFISHGKNTKIVAQIKDILEFGNYEPVVTVEKESVSKPVPEKVLDDMRACGAAIIHVGTEMKLLDPTGEEVAMLNANVLIEIGAAMMRYGRNFILLVEDGVELPSNLQGLYQVRYAGTELDNPATMKLLKAFNDFKTS